ncbi:MAG: hypothetical protein COT74_04065 [Bdellovibrionales bacterium CG10_big_fil_rev_8_21_14_0_10_45_34]|nr:MAG: hypothetical protein COT74_04065 [Bdellovibrionales bacterium CG10_big_fil_rev_8_21_14_0_10_45_34]
MHKAYYQEVHSNEAEQLQYDYESLLQIHFDILGSNHFRHKKVTPAKNKIVPTTFMLDSLIEIEGSKITKTKKLGKAVTYL